jgi:ESS family glutamate:Na+ symporter
VLFIGVILSNGLALMGLYRVFERAVSVLGNVCLSLFLAMALMSLKLWELASLALPMMAILAVQALAMALYAMFVTWRMMGKNYDAAVLAAGHCGFGLGQRRRRSPTCRRLPNVSGHRIWRFWWCRWWGVLY